MMSQAALKALRPVIDTKASLPYPLQLIYAFITKKKRKSSVRIVLIWPMKNDSLECDAADLKAATVHWLGRIGISEDIKIWPREDVRDDVGPGRRSMQTTDHYSESDDRVVESPTNPSKKTYQRYNIDCLYAHNKACG